MDRKTETTMRKLHTIGVLAILNMLVLMACNKTGAPAPPPAPPVVDTTTTVSGTITLNTAAVQQKIDLIGCGCYFNSGQLVAHPNFLTAANWLWNDLNVNAFRIVLRNGGVEDVNDNSDPNTTDFSRLNFIANTNNRDQVIAAKKAIQLNPNMKIWAIVLSPPKFLKTNNDVNNGGTINTSVPNVYEEFGEIVYAHLKNLKDSGVTVEYITLMNEPDFVSSNIGYESAHFTTTLAQTVYTNTANWLKTKLAATGISIPKFTGPDCLDVGKTPSYIQALNTTGNITHYTTHQYANSTNTAFAAASAAAGNKGLYMTENTPAFGLPAFPQTTELTVAFQLVDNMNRAFQGGSNGWLYFEWARANPNSGSLVYTPFPGAAERKKNYFAFQQYIANIIGQQYLPTVLSGTTNFTANDVSAFSSAGKTDIHILNKNLGATSSIKLNVDVNIKTIMVYRTDEVDNNKLVISETNVNKNNYIVNVASRAFTTIRITW
jgi:O-glycosyl hydrolase